MSKTRTTVLSALPTLLCLLSFHAFAGFAAPPPLSMPTGKVTFSIDARSPSFGGVLDGFGSGFTLEPGAILTPSPPGPPGPNPAGGPGPLPAPGIVVDSGFSGSTASSYGRTLSLVSGFGGVYELDALSFGRDGGWHNDDPELGTSGLYFSVDEWATGDPASWGGFFVDVSTEGAAPTFPPGLEAAADVFKFLGPLGVGNAQVIDGNGIAPSGGTPGPALGLMEPAPPGPGPNPSGDNLDALDIGTTAADVTGPIFFSLDSSPGLVDPLEMTAGLGTAGANGAVGGDILCDGCGAPGLSLFAGAGLLGLDLTGPDTDDLDALLLFEDGDGVLSAGDFVLFSVRRGSAVIGATASGALPLAIEPGDILGLPAAAGLAPSIFVPAEALGLATVRGGTAAGIFGDDLDALSAPVPIPASLPLMISALVGILAIRRRRLT